MSDRWTLEDSLSSVCADLLSERRFEPFVHRLFANPAGTWLRVVDGCVDLKQLASHVGGVIREHAEELQVTHLPWPEPDSDGNSLVVFVHRSELWSTTATYNRQRLMQH